MSTRDEDVTIQHPRTSKNTTTLLNFPYFTFSPGAAVAVTAHLLWVGLTCQSIRGCLTYLTYCRGDAEARVSSLPMHHHQHLDVRNRSRESPLQGESLRKSRNFWYFEGYIRTPNVAIELKFCTAKRTHVSVGPAKFDVNRCNKSHLRGEKPDFWPVSIFNTGTLPLCGILDILDLLPWRCRSTRQQPSYASSPACSVFSVMKSLLKVHIHLLAVASNCVNPSFLWPSSASLTPVLHPWDMTKVTETTLLYPA